MEISVIIAAYNIEDYIERCLLSVSNQTFDDIEIIVVNDGSTDNTLDRIKKILNNDSRIKLINQKNSGLIEARKSGFKESRGKYVLFVDGDDYLEHNALEIIYRKAISNNLDIVLYNAYTTYDDSRQPLQTFKEEFNEQNDPLKALFLLQIMPTIWSKLIKREYLIKNNIEFPKGISYGEDLATIATCFMYKPSIGLVNENLYNYYQRNNSLVKNPGQKILELNEAINFIQKKLIENNIYKVYVNEYNNLVYYHLFNTFLLRQEYDDIHYKMYTQYKNKHIKIKNNVFIQSHISKYPKSLKVRVKLYNFNYELGRTYDYFRKKLKNLK